MVACKASITAAGLDLNHLADVPAVDAHTIRRGETEGVQPMADVFEPRKGVVEVVSFQHGALIPFYLQNIFGSLCCSA